MTQNNKDLPIEEQHDQEQDPHKETESAGEAIPGPDETLEPGVDDSSDSGAAQELAGMKEKYIRLVAEFDNFRKRTARERIDLIKTAGEDIIQPLLEVLDDMERAEQQMDKSKDIEALKSGVTLIFNKLRNVLKNKGLKPMISVGEEFNPEIHDAITEMPAPEKDQKGKIMDEVQKGYFLNDKIIRHAKVVVGK